MCYPAPSSLSSRPLPRTLQSSPPPLKVLITPFYERFEHLCNLAVLDRQHPSYEPFPDALPCACPPQLIALPTRRKQIVDAVSSSAAFRNEMISFPGVWMLRSPPARKVELVAAEMAVA